MAKIVLIADDCRSKAAYLATCRLPDFSIEDFSIQGFAVREYDAARELLQQAGHTILDKKSGTDIIIDHVTEPRKILALLKRNGIRAELSDIADTMY